MLESEGDWDADSMGSENIDAFCAARDVVLEAAGEDDGRHLSINDFMCGSGVDIGPQEGVIEILRADKPDKLKFFRMRDEESRIFKLIKYKKGFNNFYYLVHPKVWGCLDDESAFEAYLLKSFIDTDGRVGVWPIRYASLGSGNYAQSVVKAIQKAKESWIRLIWDNDARAYDSLAAKGDLKDPVWPDMTMDAIIGKAFEGKMIVTEDHVILKKLRGEII